MGAQFHRSGEQRGEHVELGRARRRRPARGRSTARRRRRPARRRSACQRSARSSALASFLSAGPFCLSVGALPLPWPPAASSRPAGSATTSQPNGRRIRATRAVSNRLGPRDLLRPLRARAADRRDTEPRPAGPGRRRSRGPPGGPRRRGGKSSGSGTGATLMRGGAACLPRAIPAAAGTGATTPPPSTGVAPSAGPVARDAGPDGRARDPAAVRPPTAAHRRDQLQRGTIAS